MIRSHQRVLRSIAIASTVFASACASCPPIDEAALSARVLDRVEEILENGGEVDEADDGRANGRPSNGTALDALPYASLPRRGNADAPVRIVVVSDFECPFCGRLVPELDRLAEAYPDQVVFYFVNFPLPFHRRARPAATAALEAYEQGGDEAFYRMHDLIFRNQNALRAEDLVEYARQLGLDPEAMRRALADREHDATIDRDLELANSLGVTGTPTTFVNREEISGAVPYATFRAAVERALER